MKIVISHSNLLDLGMLTGTADLAAKIFPGRRLSIEPGLELPKRWLQQCITSHSMCSDSVSSPLPTRIIDVGCNESSEDPFLFVPETNVKGRYAALSYCWGNYKGPVLTMANLNDMRHGIPFLGLPKTIRDAIKISRGLGLRYLWVDSQCIIQDSIQDWQMESSNMCNIYLNAFITIQASGADNTSVGCFIQRVPPKHPPAKLNFESEDGRAGSVFTRYEPLDGIKTAEPIDRRAWTLQEALLSPRILSFGAMQMWWECKAACHSEAGSQTEEHYFLTGLPKPIRTREKKNWTALYRPNHNPELKKQFTWAFIIEDYASRRLTFAKDKLPALSGLARQMSRIRPGDTYLAGLWSKDLPNNLLWGVTSEGRRPPTYRAPSWSWASLDGRLGALDKSFNSRDGFCQILDASTTTSGLDPFGEVSGGFIKLCGQLKEAWRVLDDRGDRRVQFLYKENRLPVFPEVPFLLKLGLCELDFVDSAQIPEEPVSAWCIRLTEFEGLMVQKTAKGEYERIGLFVVDENKVDWFEDSNLQTIFLV